MYKAEARLASRYQGSEYSSEDTAVDEGSSHWESCSRSIKDGEKSRPDSVVDLDISHGSHRMQSYQKQEQPAAGPSAPPNPPPLSTLHQIALVAICCLAQFLNLAGMNQTVAPVTILANYFNIRDYGTLSWFSAAYSMSVGTFILPAGK